MEMLSRSDRWPALCALLLACLSEAGRAAVPAVDLKLFSAGFTSPLAMAVLPGGGALVVDQPGWIYSVGPDGEKAETLVADLRDEMAALNPNYDERGLLDVVLHPQFAKNRRVYLAYNADLTAHAPTNWNGSLVVSEFVLPAALPLRLDRTSERVLLRIDKPFANHNGGRMAFGPDGCLYIGVGDGGAGNDQGLRPAEGNGQHLGTLLGKVLRIDPDRGAPYAIPPSNPLAGGQGGRPEIYAWGFRNPWGLSFDRAGTHDLWVADVGQNQFEEVDRVIRGGNYGWNRREGFHAFDPEHPDAARLGGTATGLRGEPLIDPVLEYPHHSQGPGLPQGVSVVGGYIYRGKAIPALGGCYIFADWTRTRGAWGEGRIIAASKPSGSGPWTLEYIPVQGKPDGKLGFYITAMAQDQAGELYILTNEHGSPIGASGRIWKITGGALSKGQP